MAFWKDSDVFGIKYHIMKTPENHNYFTGGPVSSRGEAIAEIALTAAVALNHNSVLWAIWNRGIAPRETEIMGYFKQAPQLEREMDTFFGKDVVDKKTFGVLLIATVYESAVINQDTKAPQRAYQSTHIETAAFSYENAAKVYAGRDKLIPAQKGWRTVFYHIWAVRK